MCESLLQDSREKNTLPEEIQPYLLDWYQQHKRTLPWRDQGNPYYIWVSEIMLQQTRVEAVIPYYNRFIKVLPDIRSLAECPDDLLMKLWEGLGYYSRARNMKWAARQVQEECGGRLPEEAGDLMRLRGIGEYTAGAVASIAFGKPVLSIDGNVLRVVSRLMAEHGDISAPKTKRRIREALFTVFPQDRPGDFNQALMELGRTICLPHGRPKCGICPVRDCCRAFAGGNMTEFPVKRPPKGRRVEDRTILIVTDPEKILLVRRPSKGLLAGMYEPLNLPGRKSEEDVAAELEKMGLSPAELKTLPEARHIFSHVEWRMQAYLVHTLSLSYPVLEDVIYVRKDSASDRYPIPSAYEAYREFFTA